MTFIGGKIVTSNNGGSGVTVGAGGKFSADDLTSENNGEHGLDMHEDAEVRIKKGSFSGNRGAGIHQRVDTLTRARAANIAPSLTDDELFQALQAVHNAKEEDRPDILMNGPLWASVAKNGLDVAGAVASVVALFHGGPIS